MRTLAAVVMHCALAASAVAGTAIKDLVRIKGQGESVIQGLGLVMGLPKTGDSGKELALARPLARVLANNGDAAELKDLDKINSVALVMVTCTIPAAGARTDDTFDVTVSTMGSASSLKGGTLYITALTEPRPGGAVYAMASGKIELDDPTVSTRAKVRGGAHLIQDVQMQAMSDTFELVVDSAYAGIPTVTRLTQAINDEQKLGGAVVASVVDDRTIRIEVPEWERKNRSSFVSDVLMTKVDTSLLGLPAQVVANPHSGVIVVTGDVEISPGMITHKDLVITTVTPPPVATKADPIVERQRWASLTTTGRDSDKAKLSDLMAAFKQLDVSPAQQIEVLQLLHKSGRLHAKLIIE